MNVIGKIKVLMIVFILFGVAFFVPQVYAVRRAANLSRDLKSVNMISERRLRFELGQRLSVKKIKIAKKFKEGLELIPLNGTDYTYTVVAYQDGDTFYIAPKKSGEPIYAPKNCKGLFYLLKAQEIDLEGLNTSEAVDMSGMFCGCRELRTLNLGKTFYTSKVTDMGYMFAGCDRIHSLELGESFDTSSVKSMKYMFYDCRSLMSLDLKDHFDTSSVTNMNCMFKNCFDITSLNLRSNFDISKAKKI